jgi:hypothetical protein
MGDMCLGLSLEEALVPALSRAGGGINDETSSSDQEWPPSWRDGPFGHPVAEAVPPQRHRGQLEVRRGRQCSREAFVGTLSGRKGVASSRCATNWAIRGLVERLPRWSRLTCGRKSKRSRGLIPHHSAQKIGATMRNGALSANRRYCTKQLLGNVTSHSHEACRNGLDGFESRLRPSKPE